MEIIIKPHQTGKTQELIRRSAESGAYMVCIHRREALRVVAAAEEMGLRIHFPLTLDEFLQGLYYGRRVKSLLIDNADLFLQAVSSVPIDAMTISEQE